RCRVAPPGNARRCHAAAVRAGRAARDRPPRPCRDYRRCDLELQLVDPLGGIDAQLELPEAPRLALALRRPDEASDPIVYFSVRRRRDRAGVEGPERAGA